jgi:fatty acid desaturase
MSPRNAFGSPWQDVIDVLRVGVAVAGLGFLGYMGYLLIFRRKELAVFGPRYVIRLLAMMWGVALVAVLCVLRLGRSFSFVLPMCIIFLVLALCGYHVYLPPERSEYEAALANLGGEPDDAE